MEDIRNGTKVPRNVKMRVREKRANERRKTDIEMDPREARRLEKEDRGRGRNRASYVATRSSLKHNYNA